ncbi:lysophospholipase [Sneathiella marina]|uniref:Lysophospholipase n=1 Tax=Sneathiella marina TaxID=2950108 RepID=A0ABY4W8P7_9PROT|nr:alpha/beta hydrolase [Sneathiella marina]USG63226.1 lysophospholipase [Sneathiella marina]
MTVKFKFRKRAHHVFLAMMLVVLSSACTPVVQQAGESRVDPELTATTLTTFDDKELPVKIWEATEGTRAVIIAVHGINDYSNAFAFPGSWWSTQGITTIAYDQRGFGATPETGVWPGQDLMVRDLASLVEQAKQKYPTVPIYLLGESMGGAVVMTAVGDPEFPEVSGAILSAPAVWGWQSLNIFYKTVLWTAAHTFPETKLTGRGLGVQASDNISVLRNLGADPLFIKATRIDAIYGLVDLMDNAYEAADDLLPPILLLYGEKDELVPKSSVDAMAARLPEDVDIVLYENGWHMLMRDLQGPVVWRDIADWIFERNISSGNKINGLPLFPKNE